MGEDPFLDVMLATVQALQVAKIRYAITGSVASSIHGEPVPSQDVDFVLRMTLSQANALHNALPQRFYRSPVSLEEIAQNGGMANLIDSETGLKIDLSVPPQDPFYEAVMSRARSEPFGENGPAFFVVSPEDIVLMKMNWRKDTKSTKQWGNALSVVKVQGVHMDWKYMFEQAEVLGIKADLETLRDEAGI